MRVDAKVRAKRGLGRSDSAFQLDYTKPHALNERSVVPTDSPQLEDIDRVLHPNYRGDVATVDFYPFGRITVSHGNIFESSSESGILPMAPNLQPYRGIALDSLERGGERLIRELFQNARTIDTARKEQESESPAPAVESGRRPPQQALAGMEIGTVIPVGAHALNGVISGSVFYVVMPFFWQGTITDSARRFRHSAGR